MSSKTASPPGFGIGRRGPGPMGAPGEKPKEGVTVNDEVEQEVYDKNFKKCAKMKKTVKEKCYLPYQ